MKGSELDKHAHETGFLAVFEMAESIGGRTSETSIVGHLPAALTGVDFKAFLDKYVYGVKDHYEYLDKIGASRLLKLKTVPGYGYAATVK